MAADNVEIQIQLNDNGIAEKLTGIQKGLDAIVAKSNETGVAFQKAATGITTGAKQATAAVGEMHVATAGATREFLVLGHEVVSGNFSRIPGSLIVLAERTNALHGVMASLAGGAGVVAGSLAAVAAVGVTVGLVFHQTSAEAKEFNNAMMQTNNYAGLTEQSYKTLTASLAANGQSWSNAKDTMMALGNSGRFTADQMKQLGPVIASQAKISGQSIEEVTKEFLKLADSPKKFMDEVNKSTNMFTPEMQQMITTLEKEGKSQDAVNAAISVFTGRLKENAAQLAENEGLVDRLARGFGLMWHAVSTTIDPKQLAPLEQIAKINEQIANIKAKPDNGLAATEADRNQQIKALVEERQAIYKKEADAQMKGAQDTIAAQKSKNFQEAQGYVESLRQLTKYNEDRALLENKTQFAKGRANGGGEQFSKENEELQAQKIRDQYAVKEDPAIEMKKRQAFMDQIADVDESAKEEALAYKKKSELIKVELDKGDITQEEAAKQLKEAHIAELEEDRKFFEQKVALADKEIARTDSKNGTATRRKALEEIKAINAEEEVVNAQYEAALAKHAREISNIYDSLAVTINKQMNARAKLAQDEQNKLGLSTREAELANAEVAIRARATDEIEKQTLALKKLNATEADVQAMVKQVQTAEQQQLAQEKTYWQQKIDAENNWAAAATKAEKDYLDNATNAGKQAQTLINTVNTGIEDTLYNFMQTGSLSLKSLETTFKATLDRMVAQALAANLSKSLFGGLLGGNTSSGAGGLMSGIMSLFGGGRATGGPVTPGMVYQVNENTPNSELFAPSVPGTIIPYGQASMAGPTSGASNNVTIHAVDADSFNNLIARNGRFITDLVSNTKTMYNQ